MLNSSFQKIQNLSPNHKANEKLDEVLNSITEARKSLQNWQDQKTEAMIQLDTLSFDIRLIEEEKVEIAAAHQQVLEQMQDQTRAYQAHVDVLTDDAQLLRFEKESLQTRLKEQAEQNHLEMEKTQEFFNLQLKNLTEDHEHELNSIQENLNAKLSESRELAENTKKQLVANTQRNAEAVTYYEEKIEALSKEKEKSDFRVKQLEAEILGIRSQMMTVLRVSESGVNEFAPSNPNADSNSEPVKLRAVEIERNSVEEYLKRCGY